jgi:CRISPR-associated protein Cmr2
MNYDWASAAGEEYWDSLVRHPDRDQLFEGYAWDRMRDNQPAVTAAVLAAQGKKKLAAAFRATWRKNPQRPSDKIPRLNDVLDRPAVELNRLPRGSFLIQFKFQLGQPMLTRDDALFAVSDYAVRTDRVTGRPFLAASSWKGCLVNTLYLKGHKRGELSMIGLFGNDRETRKPLDFRHGTLRFFPSFFFKRAFRILNPHSRKKRSGTVPVELEVVPKGEKAWFTLLSVPVGGLASPDTGEQLTLVAAGVYSMLKETGFGAKTSSGFGTAADALESGRVAAVGASEKSEAFVSLKKLQDAAGKVRGACGF